MLPSNSRKQSRSSQLIRTSKIMTQGIILNHPNNIISGESDLPKLQSFAADLPFSPQVWLGRISAKV